jgi:hypothetical protein
MNSIENKLKAKSTILVIVVGFIIIYAYSKNYNFLRISIIIGLLGLISDTASLIIDKIWFKISYILGLIVPNILLGLIFYIILFPIALLSRIFKKDDPLMLYNNKESLFKNKIQKFKNISFEKPW